MNETRIGKAGMLAAVAAVGAMGLTAAGNLPMELDCPLPLPIPPKGGLNRRGRAVLKDPTGRILKSARRASRNKYR